MERFTISRRQVSGLGTLAGAFVGLGAVLLVVFALTAGFVARGALSLGSVSILGVIEIVCRNARTFTLGAPLESRTIMPDPDFKAKLERIVAAWRQMTVATRN